MRLLQSSPVPGRFCQRVPETQNAALQIHHWGPALLPIKLALPALVYAD